MDILLERGKLCRCMARCFGLVLLICLSLSRLTAAEPEADLYKAATDAFQDKFYERAEQQFAEFGTRFAASTNAPRAILLQAESRFFQKNYDGAVELLRQSMPKAGPLADQYLYWQAESLVAKGDFAGAAQAYHTLLAEFPASPLRLEVSYLEAFALFQAHKSPETVELLSKADGPFRTAANAAPTNSFSFRGILLLSESLLGLGKLEEARSTAASAPAMASEPELEWERNSLLGRIALAGPKPELALPYLSNAVSAAAAAKKPQLKAQVWNLEADVYKKLNEPAKAVGAYEKIAGASTLSLDQRRLAVLKTVELYSSTHSLTNAIARLEAHLTANTNEPAADLLHVKASELWIDQFRALVAANPKRTAAATNALVHARTHLNTVLAVTNSAHEGRAWLNLGWSLWEEGSAFDSMPRIQESETAFKKATEKLTRSDDQALAFFKMADAELAVGNPQLARTNYLAVLRNYADLPQVKNALFEKSYRSLTRACIEAGDLPAARLYLDEFKQTFPNSPNVVETTFLYGQALARNGQSIEARAVYEALLKSDPSSPLAPEIRLANARAYASEGNWPAALKLHNEWLNAFTNNSMRAEVEFERALLTDKDGNRTNAYSLFTNFVARYPATRLAAAAQNWIADYFYDQEQWRLAEQNYQQLFQNTNWVGDPLSFRAQMMAAKTAFRRQGYNDARAYLTNLLNNPKCPQQIVPEALFELGDVSLEEPITGTTNNLNNFLEAAKAFDAIINEFPSNSLAILAWGKKGDCLFQIGSYPNYAGSYAQATNAYQMVLNSKAPDVPVSARNQAEVGLGLVLKAMSEGKPDADRIALLKAARDHFLNVVYGGATKSAEPDPYYLKQAGLEAARITRELGENAAAVQLYRRLIEKAPSLKVFWEAKISALERELASMQSRN